MPFGENVLLNGKQALLFARIRGSDVDGDISRTRRQRDVITALVKKCESISTSQIGELAQELAGNVVTNCPADISACHSGLVKWYSYEIVRWQCRRRTEWHTQTMRGSGLWTIRQPPELQRPPGKTNIELSKSA